MQSFLLFMHGGIEKCINLDTVHLFMPGFVTGGLSDTNTTLVQFKDRELDDIVIPYPFATVVRHLNQVTRLPRA